MDNNLQYWDKRWGEAPNPYDGSWDDQYARALELMFISKKWPYPRSMVELGCGPFTLDEWPGFSDQLNKMESYLGLDGSPKAIEAATSRAVGTTRAFDVVDLNDALKLPQAELVLSRRCLQNLNPERRGRVIDLMSAYPAGIVLECTQDGLQRLNEGRNSRVPPLPPLPEPAFNKYLTSDEVSRLKETIPTLTIHYPLSGYYFWSRVLRNTRNDLYSFAQTLLHGGAGTYGPLTAFVWSNL